MIRSFLFNSRHPHGAARQLPERGAPVRVVRPADVPAAVSRVQLPPGPALLPPVGRHARQNEQVEKEQVREKRPRSGLV